MREETQSPLVIVPLEKLSVEALDGLISEFILREGTDYGRVEWTLGAKEAQVRKQLESGQAVVVFDLNENSCSVLRKEDLPR